MIWRRSRRAYWRFSASVLALFALGFAGYVLYPAAPPWMAAEFEAIPPVYRVMGEAVQHVPGSASVGVVAARFDVNEVAAIPSLHAAVPLLLVLVLVRLWGRRMLLTLLYPLTMGFNVVYAGEHYVVDVLAGYGVALAAYGLVWTLPDLWRRRGLPGMVRFPPITRRMEHRSSAALVSVALVAVFVVYHGGPVNTIAADTCDEVESVDASTLLAGIAGRYAAYLLDAEGEQCYSLTADGVFPPPRAEGVPILAARAPVRLRPAASRPGVRSSFPCASARPCPLWPSLTLRRARHTCSSCNWRASATPSGLRTPSMNWRRGCSRLLPRDWRPRAVPAQQAGGAASRPAGAAPCSSHRNLPILDRDRRAGRPGRPVRHGRDAVTAGWGRRGGTRCTECERPGFPGTPGGGEPRRVPPRRHPPSLTDREDGRAPRRSRLTGAPHAAGRTHGPRSRRRRV